MKRSRIIRTIHIGLHQKQANIVARIEEEDSLTEKIRDLINHYGEANFPPTPAYAQAALKRVELVEKKIKTQEEWENFSPTDYARELRARIVGTSAIFMVPGGDREIPLSEIKDVTKEHTWVKMHNDILDHNFTQLDGQKWDDATCDQRIAEWIRDNPE